jgi:hypothetical protein
LESPDNPPDLFLELAKYPSALTPGHKEEKLEIVQQCYEADKDNAGTTELEIGHEKEEKRLIAFPGMSTDQRIE